MPRVTRTNGTPTGLFIRVPRSPFPRREAPAWPALAPDVMRAASAPAPTLIPLASRRVVMMPVLESVQEPVVQEPTSAATHRKLVGF